VNLFPNRSGANISPDGVYRWSLWREWDASLPTCTFLMLNPSTADDQANDPTITRCISRARALGCGRLEVVNLYPLRSTNPDELLAYHDPVGPIGKADGAILDAVERAGVGGYTICAWGAHKAAPQRAESVLHTLSIVGFRSILWHLGLNKDGSPKHPLYVAASVKPRRWTT